jgi:O-antigen ligase
VLVAIFSAVPLAFAVAVSPATVALAVVVVAIVVLAWRSPALALAAAVLLFALEGSVKILLGLGIDLPGGSRAAGAAALDVALLAGVAGVLISDRLRAPKAVWAAATTAERVVIGLIGAWLVLSVIQIVQGGDVGRGLHGFRLFQWYAVVAVATLTVFAQPRLRPLALNVALGIALVVSVYAAVRVVIGPALAERTFATAVPTVTTYGHTLRAVGSFSSAVGLSSFLTPVVVFSLVLGLLVPRLRLVSFALAALALVGLIGSFSRASLFGVVLGLGCALVLVFAVSHFSARRKLASAAILIAVAAAMYGTVWAVSQHSPELRERAQGVLDPLDDESVQIRFDTWERNLDDVAAHPLGRGVGSVGAASGPPGRGLRTTDNSFLKVLVEQGFIGLALFVGGLFGAVFVLARRMRAGVGDDLRSVGVAALAGFVAFLGLAFAGESVEQPGKVVAWGLLGMAAAYAFASGPDEAEPV